MASATGTTGRASNAKAGSIEQNLCTSSGSSQSINIYPPQSPTRMTNDSILKLAGAFQGLNTSRIRFWAFSYSIGEPCGRSFQLIMYFILVLPPELWQFHRHRSVGCQCTVQSYNQRSNISHPCLYSALIWPIIISSRILCGCEQSGTRASSTPWGGLPLFLFLEFDHDHFEGFVADILRQVFPGIRPHGVVGFEGSIL